MTGFRGIGGVAAYNEEVNRLIKQAQMVSPKDLLTISAYSLNAILRFPLLPFMLILIPVFTFVLGILVTISFGILLMIFSVIWFPFLGIILGSSWLWLRVSILRPILFLPGVLVAVVADIYVSLIPDMGEKYQKVIKLGICDSWPYSFYVWKFSLTSGQQDTT